MIETTFDNTEDQAEAALLARLEGTEEAPAEAVETPETPEGTEAPADGDEGSTEAVETLAETFAADDHLVTVKVGEEERKVPVKDLKALLLREAEIAKRDTETVAALERVTKANDHTVSVMGQLVQEAQAEWAKYAKVDFALAAKDLPTEAYQQLRADAKVAYDRLNFLSQTGQQYAQQAQTQRAQAAQQEVAKCDEALAKDTDPVVKGWDAKARSETVDYLVAQGIPKAQAEMTSIPAVIKIIRKAALYDAGLARAKVAVTPVATSPKGVMKPGAQGETKVSAQTKLDDAMARARKSGGAQDDIEAALLARFGG